MDEDKGEERTENKSLRTVKWDKNMSYEEWRDDMLDLLITHDLDKYVMEEPKDLAEGETELKSELRKKAGVRHLLLTALGERKAAKAVARSSDRDPFFVFKRLAEQYGSHEEDTLLKAEIWDKIHKCDPNEHGNKFSAVRLYLETQFHRLGEAGEAIVDKQKVIALTNALNRSVFFENQLDVITGSFLNGNKDAAPLSYTKLVKYLRSRETVQKQRHGSKKKNNFRKPNVSANHTSTASSQNCRWHLKGNCTRGKSCKFDHPNLPKLTEVCKAFLSGKCQHGSKCRRTHPANSDGNSKSPNPPKGDGTCFLCNQKGHWVAECPMKKVAASHVQAVMNSVSSFAPSPGNAPVVSSSTSTAASPPHVPFHSGGPGGPVVYHPWHYPTQHFVSATTQPSYQRGLTSGQMYLTSLANAKTDTHHLTAEHENVPVSNRTFYLCFGLLFFISLIASWSIAPRLLTTLVSFSNGRVENDTESAGSNHFSAAPLLDSGALGRHTIAPQDISKMHSIRPTSVLITGALGQKERASREGEVTLENRGQRLNLKNAIPANRGQRSLVSLGVLADEGMTALFAKDFATVYPQGTIFTASQDPIFVFERPDPQSGWTLPAKGESKAHMFTSEEMSIVRSLSLWHDAFGHFNFPTLRRQKPWGDTLQVPSKLPNPKCDACEVVKIRKRDRGKFRERMLEDDSNDHYFFDLSGKFAQASLYGEYYYLLIKRSTSGYCWDEYLKAKSESLKLLKRFFSGRLRKLPKNIVLAIIAVSDNAKEFIQKKLKKWFKRNDIIQKTTVVDHPSDRGMIEIEMKVSKRTAATMLLHQKLPDPFAFLAVAHAVYCRNRWIQQTRDYKSPYELEFGRKPSYHLLRPFGCKCVVLLPGKPKGVDPRGVEGLFVGIDESTIPGGAWKVFIPQYFGTRRHKSHLMISTSVTFDTTPGGGGLLLRRLARDEPDLPIFKLLGKLQAPIVPLPYPGEKQTRDALFSDSEEDTFDDSTTDSDADSEIDSESNSDSADDADRLTQQLNPIDDHSDLISPYSDDEHKSEEGESEEGPTEGFLQEDELKDYATDYLRMQASQRRQPATQAQHASQASSQLASKPASQNSDAASNGSSPARIPEPTSELRRSDRSRPPSAKAIATAESNALATLGATDIPTEATLHLHPEKKHIIAAEAREVQKLIEFDVFEWSKRPPRDTGKKVTGSRFVYSRNVDARKLSTEDRELSLEWKARFVALGFSQIHGLNFFETTSPTPRLETLFLVLSIIASLELHDFQGDAKGAFLHADIDCEIYLDPPPRMQRPFEDAVWLLKKAIYGLKQAGRRWYRHFVSILLHLGFVCSDADPCLFIYNVAPRFILILFHVDDFAGGGNSVETVVWLEKKLGEHIRFSHFGPLTSFIGMEFSRNREKKTFEVRQTAYIDELRVRFKLEDCNPISIPFDPQLVEKTYTSEPISHISVFRQLVGAMIWLAQTSRKNTCFGVNFLCRALSAPTEAHWKLAKHGLKYLVANRERPLILGGEIEDPRNLFVAFSDSDWASYKQNRRSTTGCVVFFNGKCIYSETRLQKTVALHSVEAEYYALGETTKTVLFLLSLLNSLDLFPEQDPVPINLDSSGAKALARGGGEFRARKHIDVRAHFIGKHEEDKTIILCKTPSADNIADTNTKALGYRAYSKHEDSIMDGI